MPHTLRLVEDLRRQCLDNHEIILKTDYGKGAAIGDKATYPVAVKTIAGTSIMRRKHALRLYHLSSYLQSTSILELGTSLGLTTAYLALANPNARVISLEGCPELCKMARKNLEILRIGNAEVVQGQFKEKLGGVLSRLGKIDLLLIDGDHRKESVLAYLEQCHPYLHNDSVVIMDDIHLSSEMEQAWDQACKIEGVNISLDFFFSGWLFFRQESSKEHFRLRYL